MHITVNWSAAFPTKLSLTDVLFTENASLEWIQIITAPQVFYTLLFLPEGFLFTSIDRLWIDILDNLFWSIGFHNGIDLTSITELTSVKLRSTIYDFYKNVWEHSELKWKNDVFLIIIFN